MSEGIPARNRGRQAAIVAGVAVVLFGLAGCRGCREKEEAGETGEKAAASATVKAAIRTTERELRPPLPATALDKIAAAEKAGRLDLDTAWTYRILALFDPAGLPEDMRSPQPIKCGTPVLAELGRMRDRLSPEALDTIRPYLLRPTNPASFHASRSPAKSARRSAPGGPGLLYAQEDEDLPQRPSDDKTEGDWVGHECRSAPITVWAADDQASAYALAAVIDRRSLWSRFKTIMTFEPLSDENAVDEQGRPDIGIDGTLDIYLVSKEWLAISDGIALGMCVGLGETMRRPSWIMVREELQGADLEATAAHELFHSFQFALDSEEARWWLEGTACWAEEFIDVNYRTELYVPSAFELQDHFLKTISDAEGLHPYGAYIFPSYLAGRFGDAFIGEVWIDCSVEGQNALEAVVSHLASAGLELKEAWKEFALMNYDDTKDYGRKYKETLDTWPCHSEEKIALKERSEGLEIGLPPLSAFYVHVYNDGIDPDAFPGVHFDLEDMEAQPLVSVQAVIIKGGDHRVEDWTGRKERDFCLKDEADRFDDIVVVVASAEREKTLEELILPVEIGYLVECDADWVGTLTFKAEYDCEYAKDGEWRKTGAWRAGRSGPWEDQFSRFDVTQKNSFRATATVNLALKSQATKAESEEERDLMEGMNRLFGGAVYIQDGIKGACSISYHTYSKETTTVRPPGTSRFVSRDSRASGGGALTKYGMSALSGPRLSVYPEKGEYALEIDFSAPDLPGTTTIESSGGGSEKSRWTWEGGKPLFGSYGRRAKWDEPVLKGTYSGDMIQGSWKSPPRQKPKDGLCVGAMLENADITVSWSIRKIR